MRQVPVNPAARPSYPEGNSFHSPHIALLLGRGKIARHLAFYFESRGITVRRYLNARDLEPQQLLSMMEGVQSVWFLVSDSAIERVKSNFLACLETLVQTLPPLIHTSAAAEVDGMLGIHPLMTFGPELYSPEIYHSIPLVTIEEDTRTLEHAPFFEELFTLLPNPHLSVPREKQALYHALCVIASNFPQILWNAVASEAGARFQFPNDAFDPILRQTLDNFLAHREKALTGPLARGDHRTIQANLSALQYSPLKSTYESLIQVHEQFGKGDL